MKMSFGKPGKDSRSGVGRLRHATRESAACDAFF